MQDQLAEWRAKRDAARQAGGKPLEPVVNSSRLVPPASRASGLKGGRARSPAGCENERAPGQAPPSAAAGPDCQRRYLTSTKSSQHRVATAPAAAAGRPDDSTALPAQVWQILASLSTICPSSAVTRSSQQQARCFRDRCLHAHRRSSQPTAGRRRRALRSQCPLLRAMTAWTTTCCSPRAGRGRPAAATPAPAAALRRG